MTGSPSWSTLARPVGEELLVVVGPTASGKTDLAVRLAERFDGEIVSADSVQIYREFNVGSGKPTAEERALAPHHLIDALDPLEPVDAQRYAALAGAAIADIRRRGRTPIVCGGTFLWIKALIWGLSPAPPADAAVRARHHAIAEAEGRAALHARLAQVDPASAARLSPNDLHRVSRALETFELSGRTQSAWHAEHGFRKQRYAARLVGVLRERAEIDRRIEERAAAWLAAGWADEVRALVAAGYGGARAMRSVGYRQVREHIEAAGGLGADALLAEIVRATRVFVRRQRTWLRDQEVTYVTI
jgi:tRNA dimethylallyltransferase